MKKEKELKKMFGGLKEIMKKDPGNIVELEKLQKEYHGLVLNKDIPPELSFPKFEDFIQNLLGISIHYGMDLLLEKQEQEKIQKDIEEGDRMYDESDDEEVQEGPVTVVRKKKGEDTEDTNEEDVETLKKQLEEFRILAETLKGESEELKVLRPAHARLEEDKAVLEEQLTQARTIISDLEQQSGDFQEANKALHELKIENEQLIKDKKVLETENQQLKRDKAKEVQTLEQTNNLLKTDLDQLKKQYDMLDNTHALLLKKFESTASPADTKPAGAAKLDPSGATQQMDTSEIRKYEGADEEVGRLETENAKLKEDIKTLQDANKLLTKENTELSNTCEVLQKATEDMSSKKLLNDFNAKSEELAKAQNEIKALKFSLETAEKDADEVPDLKIQISNLTRELQEAQDVLDAEKKRSSELEAKVGTFRQQTGVFRKKLQEIEEKSGGKMDKEEKNEKHDISASDLLQRQLRESNALNQDLSNKIADLKAQVKGLEKDLELARAKAFEEVQAHNTAYVKLISDELTSKREEVKELRQELKSKPPTEGLKLTVLDDVKTEERARRASLFGWFTLIPPFAFLFWPFTPKRKWINRKWVNLARWPLGMIFNLIVWVILAFGILIAVHNFTPKSWNVRPYTEKALAQVETSAKKIGLEDVYLTILPEKVPDKPVEKPVDLNEYILKSEAKTEKEKAVQDAVDTFKKEVEKSYTANSKIDAKIKAAVEAREKELEKWYTGQKIKWEGYWASVKLPKDRDDVLQRLKADLIMAKELIEGFESKDFKATKSRIESLTKELEQAKENANHFDSKAAELQNKLQQSLNQVDELSKKLKEATQSNGELDGKLAEMQNKYQRALDQINDLKQGTKYAKFAPFLDKIPTIQSVGGYIELPADAPKGTANWFIKLTESFLAIEKAKVEPGFIAIHYFGDTLKAYKGSKVYFVVEKGGAK